MFSVSGMRPGDNLFLLNGIELTGASVHGVTPGGVSGELLGVDAIREFNVMTGNYSAAYGKRAGAQITMVTQSGTNQYHGSVFEFLRNSALDSRNFFDQGKIPPFRRNSFGFTVGGTIVKDKTFFFGNYEGFRQRLGLSSLAIVPDENARRGLLPDPTNPGQLVNVGVAPGVAPYFALWPLPNGHSFGDGTAESFSNPKQSIHENYFMISTDHRFSDSNSLSGVYTFDGGESLTPSANPLSGMDLQNRAQVLSLRDLHIFSPGAVNTFVLGFSRDSFLFDARPFVSVPPDLSFIGTRPVGLIAIGAGPGSGGLTPAGAATSNNDVLTTRNIFTFENQLQLIKGPHLVAVGVEVQQIQSNENGAASQYGQATFSSLRQLLAGTVAEFRAVPNATKMYFRSLQGAWYVQDTLKIKPNATLDLGLRHEFTNGWNEAHGRGSNFVLGPDGLLLTQPRVASDFLTKNNAKWLFEPRVSVTWDPSGHGQTAIRGGFGIYYSLLDDLGFCCNTNAPFNTLFLFTNSPFPIHLAAGETPGAAQISPVGIRPDLHTPRAIRYSAGVERTLTRNLGVRADYIGSLGHNGTALADLNTAIPVICSAAAGNCPASLADGTKFFPIGARRRNPQLSVSRIFVDYSDSSYNAMLLEVFRRFDQGLQFRASYTLSKSIDDISTSTGIAQINQQSGLLLDPGDPNRDRGLSGFDVRHRFSFSGSYNLPFGPGKRFLDGVSGVTEKLVSGWQLNTIAAVQSGFPFTVGLGFNQSRDGNTRAPDRPDVLPGRTPGNIILGKPARYYDPTAFTLPPAGTYGSGIRNFLIGPGLQELDMSLLKTTRVSEKIQIVFRAEVFNALNHANFGIPNLLVLNPDGTPRGAAGRITTTSTTSRQIQFGMKILW